LGVKGFGDVAVGAAAGRLSGIKVAPFRSQHDDSGVGGAGVLANGTTDGVGVVSWLPGSSKQNNRRLDIYRPGGDVLIGPEGRQRELGLLGEGDLNGALYRCAVVCKK
jgi:hypothetical protein